jgi:hypothetical protein
MEFPLQSGGSVFIEVSGGSPSRSMPAGIGKDAVDKATDTFEAALDRVKPAARALVNAFREFNEPDEIGLEFGLDFKTSANAFVFTGEANASFKLSLKWKSDKA